MAAQQTQHAQRVTRSSMLYRPGAALWFLCCLSVFYSGASFAESLFPKPLIEQYQELQSELEHSVFGSPIVLNSDTSKHHAQGDVYAVLDTPITDVQQALSQSEHWCGLAILHINIKACTFNTSQRNKQKQQQLTIYLGRKYYQAPSQAFPLEYEFESQIDKEGRLFVKLTAPDGPFGTHDYLISFEAVALDAQRSFIHFQYRYQFGFMARMAMNTYLATIGHKKVGFTVKGKAPDGEPGYVKGVQGVVERNVMRYIYAIQSQLDAMHLPEANREQQRLNDWYKHISKHPRQLVEFTLGEYLERKKQELENQLKLQRDIQKERVNELQGQQDISAF